MFFHVIDLTTALRPSLLPDESLLFVQDAVGLYDGKFKIPEYQNGQAYLTSHRACYIDNDEPRQKAIAIDLKDVERCDLYAGFLKSSPKVTLYPKAAKRNTLAHRSSNVFTHDDPNSPRSTGEGSPLRQSQSTAPPSLPKNATWICPICSFSNPVPPHFDPSTANDHTPLVPCQACGIKPPLTTVVKAAIASISTTPRDYPVHKSDSPESTGQSTAIDGEVKFRCPRCTFQNHPSLLSCEMCGASLVLGSMRAVRGSLDDRSRSDSPGPFGRSGPQNPEGLESIKFSFRAGGEKIFHERLKGALLQRKWLLHSAPPVPRHDGSPSTPTGSSPATPTFQNIGITGLERRGAELRKNNEVVIGNAFEDLAALMASAKEIIALAERFASQTRTTSADPEATALLSQLNLSTTKDMLSSSSSSPGGASLYHAELARQLAEFLTDDATAILSRSGGIISLIDLWAIFNRARGGVELVSPADLASAAAQFERLRLPIRLRQFRSGLLVVQGRERSDERTAAAIRAWLAELRNTPPVQAGREIGWDWQRWGRGVTALETAERFGWSVGVAQEELEMAEERGVLCREVGFEGVRFWENWFVIPQSAGGLGGEVGGAVTHRADVSAT